jgi:hypothetical protein
MSLHCLSPSHQIILDTSVVKCHQHLVNNRSRREIQILHSSSKLLFLPYHVQEFDLQIPSQKISEELYPTPSCSKDNRHCYLLSSDFPFVEIRD